MSDKLEDRWYALLFGVRRSIRYHNHRRRFFDALSVWTDFLTIISGGAVIFFATAEKGGPTAIFGGVASMLAALDLVIGFSIKSRDHFDLSRQFSRLEQEMTLIGDLPSEAQLKEKASLRLEIELNEPPIKRTLDVYCHNELICAMGCAESEKVELTFIQRFLKQFVSVGEFPRKVTR